jgi:hypothetical protein
MMFWALSMSPALSVDLSDVPVDSKRGPSNLAEQMIMHNLAGAYFHLTGKHPTPSASSKKTKSFSEFVQEMLDAMSIKIGSVEHAVRHECALWRIGGVKTPTKTSFLPSSNRFSLILTRVS